MGIVDHGHTETTTEGASPRRSPPPDLGRLLGTERAPPDRGRRARWLVAAAIVVLVIAGYASWRAGRGPSAPQYETEVVARGPLVVTVSATGHLAPVTTVLVGSQVSGQIKALFADVNSRVEQGQLIARIDPDIFQAKVAAARAELDSARAAVLNQNANVDKLRADLEHARASARAAEASVERARADVEQAGASAAAAAARVEQTRADVENARTVIATAQAAVARERATATNAQRELDRRVVLLRQELIAQSEKDQAETAFATARAQLEAAHAQEQAGRAALRSAEAQLEAVRAQEEAAEAARRSAEAQVAAMASQVGAAFAVVASAEAGARVARAQLQAAEASERQRQAALDQARLDLQRTEIRAPVTGVVVSRTVDVGQTVAAALQAPVLFTIAENLTQMELQLDVDEADVGQVRDDQPATFTVDAYPGRTYPARIRRVNVGSQTKEGVVSYQTVLTVANEDLSLRPGMTATAEITTATREHVLLVPNAALRFTPSGNGETAAAPGGGFLERLLPRPPRRPAAPPGRTAPTTGTRQVWVLRDGQPVPVSVTVGVTDGRRTEVTGGELDEGVAVITEALVPAP